MTRSAEGNTAFRNVKKINLLFLFVIFFSSINFSQIHLNGFGEVTKFNSVQNASSLVSAFVDTDDKPDFIVANSTNNLSLHLSSNNYKPIIIKTPYLISIVKRIKKVSTGETEYGFLSRKSKIFGTFLINSQGRQTKLRSMKFEHNPENFVVSKNGRKAIIFGNNFEGIQLIDLDFDVDQSLSLIKGKLVRDALFYDFDNDLNTDIVYYDIFAGAINLIRNEINFQLTEINLFRKVSELTRFRRADYNYDGFEDLLFSSNNGIEIFEGDSISVFEKSKILLADNDIKDFQLGDLNRDGYFDIVYLKQTEKGNKLYAAFSSNSKLSKPLLLSIIKSVATFDLAGWAKDKVAYISTDGEITILSSIGELGNSKLQFGVNPYIIFSSRNSDNSLFNIAIIDSLDKSLKLYLDGIGKYYEFPLKGLYNKLKVQNYDEENIFFVFFNKGKKLIEVAKLNLKNTEVWTRQYYTLNDIVDINIYERENTLPAITVLTELNSSIYTEEFEYRGFRYIKSEPKFIADNVIESKLTDDKSSMFLRKNESSQIEYVEKYLKDTDSEKSITQILPMSYELNLTAYLTSSKINNNSIMIISIKNSNKSYNYLLNNKKLIEIEPNVSLSNLQIVKSIKRNTLQLVYRENEKLLSSELNINRGTLSVSNEISNYKGPFVAEFLNQKNGYIFMINRQDNLIELKRIE